MASYRTTSPEEVGYRRRQEAIDGGERFVDLRLDVELGGEVLLSVGGKWDRRTLHPDDGFVAEATERSVARIHAGQLRGLMWFRSWIVAHAARRSAPPETIDLESEEAAEVDTDPDHVYSALFAGGRRGGKSWLAVALAVIYAIAFPTAIVWIVSPSDKKHDEVRRYIAGLVPRAWLESANAEGWELANGSRIMLKSGYDPEGLKEGEVNFVLLNEAQRMKQRVYTVARGGIVDKAGLVLACANPPVEAGDQAWVSDFAADAAAGKRASVYLEFNPLDNPHIDRRALLAMRHELDERAYAIEVLGQFRGPRDAVAYNWIRLENEIPVGDSRVIGPVDDVTERFLAEIGEGEGIEQLIGLDVQRFPYIGGPVYRFFAPRDVNPTRDNVLAWICGEVVLDGGDEVDWCHELGEGGYEQHSTLIVCDASGRYQHSRRRKADDPPPEWRGRGSFAIIRGEGYRRIVPPSRTRKSNPEIVDRVRAFTSMIANVVGRRRLFCDPELAPRTAKAIREWKTIHGTPSRSQQVAHLGDGASYPMVRVFPRMLRSDKQGAMDPVVTAVDRPSVPAAPLRVQARPLNGGGRGRRGRGL